MGDVLATLRLSRCCPDGRETPLAGLYYGVCDLLRALRRRPVQAKRDPMLARSEIGKRGRSADRRVDGKWRETHVALQIQMTPGERPQFLRTCTSEQ